MEITHKIIGQVTLLQDREQKNKYEMDKQIFMLQATFTHKKQLNKIQMTLTYKR